MWTKCCLVTFFICSSLAAFAHGFLPAKLEIEEVAKNEFMVLWEANDSAEFGEMSGINALKLNLPKTCKTAPASGSSLKVKYFEMDCRDVGIVGQTVSVSGLNWNKIEAIAQVRLLDGTHHKFILKQNKSKFKVPAASGSLAHLLGFFSSGMLHIFIGLDHILFLLTMLFLFRTLKARVQVVTAFTLGHSISLSLATLNVLVLPLKPVEVLIAWTIAFAAYEALKVEKSNHRSITKSYPWLVTGAFGFIHGFGFAAVLQESGLQGANAFGPLLSFNLGVELGQLLIVALAVSFVALARKVRGPWIYLQYGKTATAYATGALAIFWVLDRL